MLCQPEGVLLIFDLFLFFEGTMTGGSSQFNVTKEMSFRRLQKSPQTHGKLELREQETTNSAQIETSSRHREGELKVIF